MAERPAPPTAVDPVEPGAGGSLLQRWSAQRPFGDQALLERRLAGDGLCSAEFAALLDEPAVSLQRRVGRRPAWQERLAAAYLRPRPPPAWLPQQLREALATTLLAATAPLVHQALHELERALEGLTLPGDSLDPPTVAALAAGELPELLLPKVSRVLVLELHVARLRGDLPGQTPVERYAAFLDWLGAPVNSLAIWQEYASLARLLVVWLGNWCGATVELVGRLRDDLGALAATFGGGRPLGPVTGWRSHVGDAHEGGRTVTVLTFASGCRVAYKPRSLAASAHFQAFLPWLDARGWPLPLRRLAILEGDGYGWMELVEARGCCSVAEVRRFYRRLGGQLALLHALRATDFHFQNLIADGDQPVLVDLETFLQPPSGERHGFQAESPAYELLVNSVVRTGLLPQRLSEWMDSEPLPPDFSGMGGVGGQVFGKGIPQWRAVGTDQMHLAHGRESLRGEANQPFLDGHPVDPLEHAEELLAGFADMYELLVRHREELLAEGGPLALLAGDQMRTILRGTMVYSMLLKDGRHPDLMRSGLERDRHWDRLWVGIEFRPELEPAIPGERHSLQCDDVPLFRFLPASRDLWGPGGLHLPAFFAETGEALTRQRMLAMGPADLERQRWFIRAALGTMARAEGASPGRGVDHLDTQRRATPAELVAGAQAMAERLRSSAVWRDGEVGWIGMAPSADNWVLSPTGSDLYSGLPGIALFFAYLGELSGSAADRELAEATLLSARRADARTRQWQTLVGAFSGRAGWVYVLAHLGALWRRPELLAEAAGVAAELPPLIAADEYVDVMAGAAGCAAALLALYTVLPDERVLSVARRGGERLLERAQVVPGGTAWAGPVAERPLTGFSHGAAGVAWALLRLASATGERRYRDAALAAIAYERSLYSTEQGNWPDLRPLPPHAPPFAVAWCHGAAGIGLARLDSLDALDAEASDEVAAALATTLRQGFGRSHCLCHGDLGCAELVLLAEDRLHGGNGDASRLAGAILGRVRSDGPRCGVPSGLETPGLMNGLAGIGYGLLRLAEPERVPSVLLLEAPRG